MRELSPLFHDAPLVRTLERRDSLTLHDPQRPSYQVPTAQGGPLPVLGRGWRALLIVMGLWPLASLLWGIHAFAIRQHALAPLLAHAFLNKGMEMGGAYLVPGFALIPSGAYALARTILAWRWPTLDRTAQANRALRHFRRAIGWAVLAFAGMAGWLFAWSSIY